MPVASLSPQLESLIQRLDAAVLAAGDAGRCRAVKRVLSDEARRGDLGLDPADLRPALERYARRLLHWDPGLRYTLLAMVWDRGQGTALHDHAGVWCVECVYRGRIRITSYSVRGGDLERDLVRFEEESAVLAGVGEGGRRER